jgi:DNA-binding GntR family transcriptional regulator
VSQEATASRVDSTYEHIRHGILSGAYAPGTPLRLHTLAAEAGVSMIPVREALRRLASERLVLITPNRGAQVAPLSLNDVDDAYRVRTIWEVEALRHAVPHNSKAEIKRARRHAADMVKRFDKGDHIGCHAEDRALHFELYQHCGSPWMLQIIENLWDHTTRYRAVATPLRRDMREVGDEHVEILDAIEAGDVSGAVNALSANLHHTVSVLGAEPN